MNEVHYQLDLLMAINQKLSTREKMYTMICEASNCAYLYFSFEKNQSVREDHKNLFDNPEYQEKLSARQMLEAVQPEFNGGYVEVWDK